MKIDWIAKLRHFLQTLAFCLAISAVYSALQPERRYEVALVYSVLHGTFIWAAIDFGRHLIRSARETGWPRGPGAWLLPAAGIAAGYLLGTLGGDRYFGWSSWESPDGRMRTSLIATVISGIVATYYFYSRNKSAWLQARMTEARQQASEARLKLLETQLEPHMLFNTLANLRALIGADPQRATHMLDRLIDYLRATLGASRVASHPLQSEFDRLRDYLELMAVRLGPRLRYALELDPAAAQCPVPSLLLQPLVENSIRHGIEPKLDGGEIRLSARRADGLLRLELRDTGVGAAAPAPARSGGQGGFGLEQVRERLHSAYGDAARMEFTAGAQGGAHTLIVFPCEP